MGIVKKYNIIDFETGNKITGSGFPLYIGKGAKLKRALINFFLDRNMQAGYTECQVPLLINESSAFGTGQLPDKEGQMYHVTVENLFLIPTSEVPLTNMLTLPSVSKSIGFTSNSRAAAAIKTALASFAAAITAFPTL